MQLVQAAIVLEILLGDRAEADLMGLASLLANRLAYLIGHSPNERRRIVSDFKRLYDFRSRVVHAGAAEIDDSGRQALFDLQKYARLALHAQIGGLADDERLDGLSSSG